MSIAKPTDSELRELLGRTVRRSIKLVPYVPDPIRLSDLLVNSLLAKHLGGPKTPVIRASLTNEIKKAAEYFLDDVAIQSLPTPHKSLAQLKRVESAARQLRDALKWDGESTETIPLDPAGTWLRQAAEKYGNSVKVPTDLDDVSYSYWAACAVPHALAGVRLLEIWAYSARDIIRSGGVQAPGKHALRVAVHRLSHCWMQAHGQPPGRGFREATNKADGPFMRFANDFFSAMRDSVTDAQRRNHPGLTLKLLQPSPNTIRQYLRIFLNRLPREQRRARRAVKSRRASIR